MIAHHNVNSIRDNFAELFFLKSHVGLNRESTMKSIVGTKTLELVGASFIADEPTIFGTVNNDYVKREEEWYYSQSLNVNDIPGGTPEVWKAIAASDGTINSNYGWCLFSGQNGSQYENLVKELKKNPESRRAIAIYTRPSMWIDYNADGRSDFMCTNAVQYVIRDGACDAVVQMRSNDALIGYKNDRAWQQHVLERVAAEVGAKVGKLYWQVGSLHVYERDFYLVHHYAITGKSTITKSRYKSLYPESELLV